MSEQSDASLVDMVAQRREPALAELYTRHSGAVHGLCRRVLQNETLADDVVQEIFLRLWREPGRFDAKRGSLRSFLMAQAHGKSVDLVRQEVARKRREVVDGTTARAPAPNVEERVVEMDIAANVRRALAALDPLERRAIELAYFGGHSYRETAALLGEPEGTTKSRIRTGMRRMRDHLARDLDR